MIRSFLNIYVLLIILDAVLSYFPQFRQQKWAKIIKQTADFTLAPVRKLLPPDLPFDISPLVVIFGIRMLMALW